MVVIKADSEGNILNVTSTGVVSVDEKRKIIKLLKEEIQQLREGLIIVHDISQLRLYNEDYYQILEAAHEQLNPLKPSKIIRIVGTARETLAKFAKFDMELGIENVQFVPDKESAQKILDE